MYPFRLSAAGTLNLALEACEACFKPLLSSRRREVRIPDAAVETDDVGVDLCEFAREESYTALSALSGSMTSSLYASNGISWRGEYEGEFYASGLAGMIRQGISRTSCNAMLAFTAAIPRTVRMLKSVPLRRQAHSTIPSASRGQKDGLRRKNPSQTVACS
ncbi:unnamed protein product [Heligmosomoides polygyrus]|uniref:Ketoacyl_synth_N domain-containing protein n=1 Tax=Heligmosomoides polygyrus TaxID=6339 RepID=A0A183GB40_HELPZ|nr:unnamed protein product [Heligmosomoides polygyrus]